MLIFLVFFLWFISWSLSFFFFFFLMIRRPPRSTLDRSSAASDVYKRQAFYEVQGAAGWDSLIQTIAFIQSKQKFVILDAKRGDIGNTCLLYTSPSPRDRTRSRMPSSAWKKKKKRKNIKQKKEKKNIDGEEGRYRWTSKRLTNNSWDSRREKCESNHKESSAAVNS